MKNLIPVLLVLFFFSSIHFSQTIQWEQLNGPFGGTALSFVTNSNGDIFAGADQDQRGIFHSTDAGLTWQPKSAGLYLSNRAFNWLVVDDSSYIIAGTSSHIGNKVYKSKDNGESWTEIANLGGKNVAVNDSGHIYVGNTGYAQYSVSKDGGYTWVHYPSPAAFTYCITFNDSGHIFIGGNYTGYRSTDNGVNWTNLGSAGLPDGITSIAIAPNGNLFAGCSRESSTNSGVYKSTDNGDSWTAVKQGIKINASHNIVINYAGDIFVGSYGWGIWKSTDEGATWTQQNSGLGHLYIEVMHISNNGVIFAGTSGGGIYRSDDDGESWQQVGLTAAGINRLAISPLNGNIFALVSGVSRSTDSGQNWEPINSGLVNFETRIISIKNDGTIFCGFGKNNYGIIYRSTDNGNSWQRSDGGLPNDNVAGITNDLEGNVFVSLEHDKGIHKSTDNGETWFSIGNVPGGKLQFNSLGDLFLASYGGGMWKLPAGDSVWVSLGGTYITTLFISSKDHLYIDRARSTDNGLTWINMPIGNTAYSYAENSVGHLFAGTFNYGSGVKRSTDYGETWESINTGIPTNDVRPVVIDFEDYLYAGPWGYSLFKTTTSTLVSVEAIEFKPATFYLDQNYPNPFNPSTKISWQSPIGSWQTIRLFDVLGREIETIVDGYYEAGSHSTLYIVNSTLPSGVYFYQLKAGEFIQTKKMVYLK